MSRAGTLILSGLILAGCGDPFGAGTRPVPPVPTTVSVSDFRAGPLREPSAFSVEEGRAVRVDQSSNWDFVYFQAEGGAPQLRPRGMILQEPSDAGLQRVESSFEGLTEAPEEGYVTDAPVAADSGAVIAFRSRQDPDFGGLRCRRFGKLEVTSVDPEVRTITFRHIINPNCGNRDVNARPLNQQ